MEAGAASLGHLARGLRAVLLAEEHLRVRTGELEVEPHSSFSSPLPGTCEMRSWNTVSVSWWGR